MNKKEFENYINFDLYILTEIIKNGVYAITECSAFWYSQSYKIVKYEANEIRVNFDNESFDIIDLIDRPDEDTSAWYLTTLYFDDYGRTYFLTKEGAEKRLEEIKEKKEKITVHDTWCGRNEL